MVIVGKRPICLIVLPFFKLLAQVLKFNFPISKRSVRLSRSGVPMSWSLSACRYKERKGERRREREIQSKGKRYREK